METNFIVEHERQAVDVSASVLWVDGSVTEHVFPNVPGETLEAVAEELSMALAEYLDVTEWPLDSEGFPLAWVAVNPAHESA
jgi:hypothetical protein